MTTLSAAQQENQQVAKDTCDTVGRATIQAESDLTQMQIAVSTAEATQAASSSQRSSSYSALPATESRQVEGGLELALPMDLRFQHYLLLAQNSQSSSMRVQPQCCHRKFGKTSSAILAKATKEDLEQVRQQACAEAWRSIL